MILSSFFAIIPISKELINLAEASANENYYYTIGRRDIKVEFVEQDYNTVMKNYPTVKLDAKRYKNTIIAPGSHGETTVFWVILYWTNYIM